MLQMSLSPRRTTARFFTNDGWANGIKDFFLIDAVHTCPNAPAGVTAGLFETGNYEVIVPDMDLEMPALSVAAWRTHAESFGYPSCN